MLSYDSHSDRRCQATGQQTIVRPDDDDVDSYMWCVLPSPAADPLQADYDTSGLVLTRQQHVTTISDQQDQGTLTLEDKNAITPSRSTSSHNVYTMSPRSRSHSGPLGSLWTRDQPAEVFVESFIFWLDTVEMVRVAGEPSVFYSDWVFPVYIFCFLSTLRLVITPGSPLLASAGVFLQDFPFFFLRVALIAVFSFVSPLLYPLKNLLVCLTFIYFTFLTKLRIFRGRNMFWGWEEQPGSLLDKKLWSSTCTRGWMFSSITEKKKCKVYSVIFFFSI